ncbi:DUF3261 domain-containing protein [Pseudomonas turukhanskensis]|uniref:DUF3261 domain-containing protein n=1 Tax=Pseudomonas turukhanskensis TaxID=1806536 RepID=UPI0022F2AC90|nr:DUF3261 domain-containing protein [Pseudomonas turukhanskensis]
MKRLLPLLLLLLLSACARQAPLPDTPPRLDLPLQLHVQREQAGQTQDWLLVVQQEGPALRWSLMDPMGIPVARQLLSGKQWQNDGLLPPNPEARELFAALLFALTPAEQLPAHYKGADWQQNDQQRRLNENGSARWHVTYQHPLIFQLSTQPGLSYRVETLP